MPMSFPNTEHDPHDGYDASFFARLAEIEDRHFWFRYRNYVIASTVAQLAKNFTPCSRMLEAGCGNGNVLRFLTSAVAPGVAVGVDLFGEGLRLARIRSTANLVQGDVHNNPFGCRFDLIGAFDVIEHLHDDRCALIDFRRMLSDRGRLLLTVPAHQRLWSRYDETSGHRRRYSREQLASTLGKSGFRVEYMTEFMMATYPMMWAWRHLAVPLLSAIRPGCASADGEGQFAVVPVLNQLLLALLYCEWPLLRRRTRLPFGSSILVIAKPFETM